jgi:hypothetical protein
MKKVASLPHPLYIYIYIYIYIYYVYTTYCMRYLEAWEEHRMVKGTPDNMDERQIPEQ